MPLLGVSGRPTTIEVSVSVGGTNVDLFADVVAAAAAQGTEDPTLPTTVGQIMVTFAAGLTFGSSSTSTPALKTGSGYGAGWTMDFLLASGTVRIQGAGGAGGRGLFIANNPQPGFHAIGGGGGGGAGNTSGAGGPAGGTFASAGAAGTATAGGAGGVGYASGGGTSAGNVAPSSGNPGGPALEASIGGCPIRLRPSVGSTFEIWGGGGGGAGNAAEIVFFGTPDGAPGGGPGLDGTPYDLSFAGGSFYPGGAHGKAYYTPASHTITALGPGTVDARGA